VRTTLRKRLASRLRPKVGAEWPILPVAAAKPSPWPGWPDGKRFALVLTHDVERPEGLRKTPLLADLEEKLGFVSAINFVPEGDYEAGRGLRESLEDRGFEVGVHDLHHDGKLYSSREKFRENAKRINEVLAEWGSVGFRSGFMHHNLEWLLDLNVEYDMSTFDTDPFEPQPDAVNTIFPFWVSSVTRPGYMELPYTLPQDSTVFLCLGEKDISIWKRKLDWIAEKGGMALLNVHPDYVSFENHLTSREFPVNFYAEFLKYARERYAGEYWAALPREVARFYQPFKPARSSAQVNGSVAERFAPQVLMHDAAVAGGSCVKAI
jgi:hypothetical protein